MKRIVRMLLLATLVTFIVLTFTASRCANERTSETLLADMAEVDAFLENLNPSLSAVTQTQQVGIILHKSWTDNVAGDITSVKLIIRTLNKQNVEILRNTKEQTRDAQISALRAGQLVAFKDLYLTSNVLALDIDILMTQRETGFTKVVKDHSDISK